MNEKPPNLDGPALVNRIRAFDNAMGATYRLCCLQQPSSFTELVTYVRSRAGGALPDETISKMLDGHSQWVAAGKPGAVKL